MALVIRELVTEVLVRKSFASARASYSLSTLETVAVKLTPHDRPSPRTPMTDRSVSGASDSRSTFSGLIERMMAFRIELAGVDLSILTEKECQTLGEECARTIDQLNAMLAYLATYETPDDSGPGDDR
jgi:hypothetical protein